MIAVDTNLLVHAHREDSPFHNEAYACLRSLAEGNAAWAIPWPCVHEFLAIVTHPRIFDPPTPSRRAIEQIEAWIESPHLSLISESGGYLPCLASAVAKGRIRGAQVHDARVAALCLHHGVRELWTADRDFSRFRGFAARNPLVEQERIETKRE